MNATFRVMFQPLTREIVNEEEEERWPQSTTWGSRVEGGGRMNRYTSIYNPSPWEVEAERSRTEGQAGLQQPGVSGLPDTRKN